MTVRTGLFHYVPHPQVDDFMRRGWMIVGDLGRTHGFWSVLMWHCECGQVAP